MERLKKRNIMVLCDMMRGLFVLSIVFLYVGHLLNPWVLLGVTFFNSTVEALRVPAGLSDEQVLLLEVFHIQSYFYIYLNVSNNCCEIIREVFRY